MRAVKIHLTVESIQYTTASHDTRTQDKAQYPCQDLSLSYDM